MKIRPSIIRDPHNFLFNCVHLFVHFFAFEIYTNNTTISTMTEMKLFYKCGCIGNVSAQNVFKRISGCDEHDATQYNTRPNSKIISWA